MKERALMGRQMMTVALSAVLGLAVVFGSSGVGFAKPIKSKTSCTCTCVAFNAQGKRYEGGTIDFNTSGNDCSVGASATCYVGDLKGAYAACTGHSIPASNRSNPGGTGGVAQPDANPPSGGVKPPVAPGGYAPIKQ